MKSTMMATTVACAMLVLIMKTIHADAVPRELNDLDYDPVRTSIKYSEKSLNHLLTSIKLLTLLN